MVVFFCCFLKQKLGVPTVRRLQQPAFREGLIVRAKDLSRAASGSFLSFISVGSLGVRWEPLGIPLVHTQSLDVPNKTFLWAAVCWSATSESEFNLGLLEDCAAEE